MNLHHNRELLQDAILATAEHLGIRAIYVEKDYWVTVALYAIFHSDIANQYVFKGGTALSKCYKLIERFSEDIDLVVLRHETDTDGQLKKKIRAASKVVNNVMPEIEVEGLTNKRGNIRKTVHQYDKLVDGEFSQVREHVVVEATWLGNFEPFSTMKVGSYVHDMMKSKGQYDLIEQYNMTPFPILVLSKLRTFCEKIMSLVRFSRTANPIDDLRNKIRHIYDIHQLLKDNEVQQFLINRDFDEMLIKVGKDDIIGYKNNNKWIYEHPSQALIFDCPAETWEKLSAVYHGNFKDLVIGQLPVANDLVTTLELVADRLKKVQWVLS